MLLRTARSHSLLLRLKSKVKYLRAASSEAGCGWGYKGREQVPGPSSDVAGVREQAVGMLGT